MLRALLLHHHHDAARDVGDAHRQFRLVDVLAAGALGPHGVDAQVGLVDGDVDLLDLGQHRDGRGGGVDAARRLGVGHALHAMDAGFELEPREGAAAPDLGDDFLEAALGALARGQKLGLPAMVGGIALVHAVEIAGEQRGLVAAGAGADFEDDVALVHRVLGQEGEPDVLLQGFALALQQRALFARDVAHLRVGRGIGDHLVEVGELGDGVAIGFHLLDHRRDLGELAGELDIGLRRQLAGELRLERGVARQHDVELGLGKHEHASKG